MAENEIRIPFRNKLGLQVFRHYRKIKAALHDLTYLFWECTLRCNLTCLHCGSDCQKHSDIPDMPLVDFLHVLDEIKNYRDPSTVLLALTGGEPLLRNDLEQCGQEFTKRGFPWGMVTNGYALTDDRFKRLYDAGLRSMTVSLDGLRESHNWLRQRNDSYEKAIKAIEKAVAKKQFTYDVVTCVNQKNIGELEALKKMLCDMGVKKWRIFTIFPKGRAKNDQLLDVHNEQFKMVMDFIVATRKENKIDASYSCEGFLGAYEAKVRDGFFFCHAGIHIGSVLVDGGISACPSLRGDYIQGNIYRDSFMDVWNNRYQKMRNRGWTKVGVCEKCNVFKWCNGNGLHLREEKTGEVLRCHYKMLENCKTTGS